MNDSPREHPDFIEAPQTTPPSAPTGRLGDGFGPPPGTRLSDTTRLPADSRTPDWPVTPDRAGHSGAAQGRQPDRPQMRPTPPPPQGYATPPPPQGYATPPPPQGYATQSPPQGRPTPPTQQSLPGNPFRTAAPVRNPDHRASYGDGRAFEKRASRRGVLAGILAVALLSAGLGGVAGVTATNYFDTGQRSVIGTTNAPEPAEDQSAEDQTAQDQTGQDQTGRDPSSNSTTVAQADPSNPDWEVTAEAVSPAVVAIQVRSAQGAGAGSGVIIDTDGTIVTNNHVIAGGEIRVVVADRVYEADVVGTDPSTDLAVIRLVDPPSGLSTLEFADYEELAVGQPVMAVGNPLGLSDTVTTGIISALNRPVTTEEVTEGDTGNGTVVTAAIQTSAAINPGNSGGALVDGSGRLVGITSSIAAMPGSGGSSGNIGIGFAIPVNQVDNIVGQLLTDGTVTHAQLGVSARDAAVEGLLGAQVAEVVEGSAAAEGGLQAGDVITKVDDVTIANSEALVAMIRNAAVGQSVTLTYVRGGAENSVEVTLGAAQ